MENKSMIIVCKPFLETSWLFQDAETQSEDEVVVISILPEKCYVLFLEHWSDREHAARI